MDLLILKTFFILAMMLFVTALAGKRNNAFETKFEFWALIVGLFALLFIIPITTFPLNFGLALVFAFLMGSLIGPGIKALMLNFVIRKTLQREGLDKQSIKNMSEAEREQKVLSVKTAIELGSEHSFVKEWNNIFQLALYSTAIIAFVAGVVVFTLNYDFSFLGQILFVSLLGLIIVGLLNIFFYRSPLIRLIGAYAGAVIFTLYLLFDFNKLEQAVVAGDVSWETAISYGISIYLDIINLFLDLLEILSSE